MLFRSVEHEFEIGLLLLLHLAVAQDVAGVFREVPAFKFRFAFAHPLEAQSCCYECLLMDLDTIFQSGSSTRVYEHKIFDLLNQKILIHNYFPAACTQINDILCSMLDLLRFKPGGYTLLLQGYAFLLFGQLFQNHFYSEAPALSTEHREDRLPEKSGHAHLERNPR